jgi:hypothetical protein
VNIDLILNTTRALIKGGYSPDEAFAAVAAMLVAVKQPG